MSQQWALVRASKNRQSRKSKTKFNTTSTSQSQQEPYKPPISYTLIEHLKTIARAQHNIGRVGFSIEPESEAYAELQEDYLEVIADAFDVFETRLVCQGYLGRFREFEGEGYGNMVVEDREECVVQQELKDMRKKLMETRVEMEESRAEDVKESMVKGWADVFEVVEEKWKSSRCVKCRGDERVRDEWMGALGPLPKDEITDNTADGASND